MKALVAGAAALAGIGFGAMAQPSPNAFIYWNLFQEPGGASLVSDRDYHRPEGLRVSFSCTAGGKNITVREYLNTTDRTRPSLPLSRRDRLRIKEGCDATCQRHSDAALRNFVKRPADLESLRPTSYGEASLRWNASTQTLVDRYLLDPAQFGDAGPAAVQNGLAKQRNLIAQFKAACQLK